MLQRSFYPHPTVGSIELLQTHVSYVLLTGPYVYKIKKPVNFGFLDYSTLEQRRHFCTEEIRLNQRGAKDLYLEVLPISILEGSANGQTSDKFTLGRGETVEYALKMVQFPQTDLLSNRFAAGSITADQMVEMGQVVATFHGQSQTSDYISSFGEIPRVRQSIDDNYRQTEKYIGIAQTERHYRETKEFTDRFFASHGAAFERRVQGKFIRECHGDLHLQNVCIWQDRIQLFDCIEFNEPFRFVDTMYDVAFAVMDLTARQRTDLGNVFLNTYLEQTGDWAGLEVLPIYLSRQAYVRAKVTSFLLDDRAVPAEQRVAAQQTAGDYYRLAWEYTQRPQGQILVMAGLSGSGKSTLGRQIARRLNGIHLRSDAIRKHLGGIGLFDRGGPELYTAEMTAKTYDRLIELGSQLAQQGYTVILDAKFDRQSLRRQAISLEERSANAGALPVRVIHCQAPLDILTQRLHHRTGDIADATADLLAAQQTAWEDFWPAELPYVTTVDTTQDLTDFLNNL